MCKNDLFFCIKIIYLIGFQPYMIAYFTPVYKKCTNLCICEYFILCYKFNIYFFLLEVAIRNTNVNFLQTKFSSKIYYKFLVITSSHFIFISFIYNSVQILCLHQGQHNIIISFFSDQFVLKVFFLKPIYFRRSSYQKQYTSPISVDIFGFLLSSSFFC